jgi:hypothetical protein
LALEKRGSRRTRRLTSTDAPRQPEARALAGFRRLRLAPYVSVHSVFALPAILLALTPFHSAAEPLPPPVQKQLKAGGFWQRGCPVSLSGLRLLTVSHRGFDGRTHTGQLIVNRRAAWPLARVFRQLYGCISRSATCAATQVLGSLRCSIDLLAAPNNRP